MNVEQFLNFLQDVKKTAGGWISKCPAHDDYQASLSISTGDDGRILLKCFAGCDTKDIAKALRLQMKDLFAKENVCLSYPSIQGVPVSQLEQPIENKGNSTKKLSHSQKTRFVPVSRLDCTLQNYSEAKKLPKDFLNSVGIEESTYKGNTKLVIPYFNASGELVCRRFRLSIADGQKFAWEKGSHPCLYGAWRLKDYPDDFIVLIEGESDCHTLWFSDIPAIGLPGATMWKEARDAHHFEKFDTIYAVIEPDQGGENVLKSLSRSNIKQKVKLVFLSAPLKDVSAIYLDDPDKFKGKFTQAISQAIPFAQYQHEQLKAQQSEAWQKCQDLARSPDILNEVYAVAQEMGVTGEERIVKLLYLAMVSRFLDRPVSVTIKGPSAAGKSHVLDTIVKLFPAEAYYLFTAMSDRTLAFTEAEFKHRIILLAEASGLVSDFQSYLIRTLLSEGRIVYETVEKTKDGFKPRRIDKEGPTGFICTTTAINLHPENETRMLSLTVNDSKEQTRAILMDLANKHSRQRNSMEKWHALQKWLETQIKEVEIPYAMELAERISPVAVRLRRDFTALLNLIKASAVLHQINRTKNEKGEIVAILDDYRTVYWLIADLIAEGAEMTVPEAVREAVKAVKEITSEDKNCAKIRDIANYLRIDQKAAERRLKRSATLSYLKNNNPGRGKVAQYVLEDALPDDIQILPSPESLTWTPEHTGTSGNVQVKQAQHAENTTKLSNWDTGTHGMKGVNKHKHLDNEASSPGESNLVTWREEANNLRAVDI